jgi:multicomponent Na+:H+ antiporter subunit E
MRLRIALLALAWIALTGDLSPGNTVFALVLGTGAALLERPLGAGGFQRIRPLRLPGFLLYFLGQLVLANLRVVRALLTPLGRLRPAIVAVPLSLDREAEIALLANLITLTPGTLSLELSEDQRTLFVHAIGVSNPAALRREIRHGFERRILEALR